MITVCRPYTWDFVLLRELNDLYCSPSIVRVIKLRGMRRAGHVVRVGRGEAYLYLFCWGNLRERDHLGDPGIAGRMALRWIFRKWGVRTRSSWLRIGTDGGHL
jgi:hypothetical protein